mgnify:CR=1 FL=1
MSVQRKRHVAKAFTWRILASIVTFIVGWSVTGNFEFGMTIGILDVVVKLILYYFHERIWYKSDFGVIHDDHNKNK